MSHYFGAFLLVVAVMLLVRDRLPLADGGGQQPLIWVLLVIGVLAGASRREPRSPRSSLPA